MRICDRCQATAVDRVTFDREHEEFDLCLGCAGLLRDLITTPPVPEEEPPKKRRSQKEIVNDD